MRNLFEAINLRRRPEDVVQMIVEILEGALTSKERRILNRAAAGSIKRSLMKFTSMMEDFARPIAPERQVRKAIELFSTTSEMTTAECADAERVEAFICQNPFNSSVAKRWRMRRCLSSSIYVDWPQMVKSYTAMTRG